jgi:hypothetical protein
MKIRIRVFATALLVVPGSAAAQENTRAPIVGALEPERLPESSVWDNAFAAIHDLTGRTTDPRAPQAKTFMRSNLFVSDRDAAIILTRVVGIRARLAAIEKRWAEMAESDAIAQTASFQAQLERETLAARDDILTSLSPRGRKALLRWIAVIKQGMVHTPAQ